MSACLGAETTHSQMGPHVNKYPYIVTVYYKREQTSLSDIQNHSFETLTEAFTFLLTKGKHKQIIKSVLSVILYDSSFDTEYIHGMKRNKTTM